MTAQITIESASVDGLLFTRMWVEERLGQLFTYEVEFESENTGIDLTGLLKTPMAIKLETQEGYKRYFHGMVCEAEQTAVEHVQSLVYAKYRVRLVPKPWLLGGMVDCRIFKDKKTTDIVKTVLSEAGYTDVDLGNLGGSYTAREYCVQYREDGWSFIQRLLQQEGIYYYFTHNNSKHTMMLADGVGSHSTADGFAQVPYQRSVDSVLRAQSTISEWTSLRGVDGSSVQLTDYNPLKPKASLLVNSDSNGHGASGIKVFDYPGPHGEANVGTHYSQVRAEALSAARSRYVGNTDACSIEIGGLFKLQDHPRGEFNVEYLVTATSMQLSGPGYASGTGESEDLVFFCTFEALESSQPWRAPQTARKPLIYGVQTAVVTGSETDEDIAVDKYGRIQVNFHWNMPGKENADCSCYARVSSAWAGKQWGSVNWPRVGQEVVVSFIEGDPDYPLVVGSVYNGVNMPPYDLPANKTQSGVKSRSLLGGTADFNELRFEDKAGSEDFFIHAQKDMHEEVENDHTVTIDHDEIITIKNDQTAEIKNNRTHTVDNDDKLTVKNDQTVTVQNNRTHKVDQEEKLTVGANSTHSITQKFKLDAGTEIQLVCGMSSITMKASGEIEIKGSTIKINGMQKIEAVGMMGVKVEGMKVELEAMTTAKMVGALSASVEAGMAAKVVGGAQVGITGALIKLT
ncbi:MAG TPA: type VI secretion system tip protein TssI/VgrG [Rhodanobacteraceae bacterium]|jgi:type VI secretion system secreted protein VgrG|nr:type VI secretion system tip protein TssI/VgrG [Rhodanobacteraceae bacterium]